MLTNAYKVPEVRSEQCAPRSSLTSASRAQTCSSRWGWANSLSNLLTTVNFRRVGKGGGGDRGGREGGRKGCNRHIGELSRRHHDIGIVSQVGLRGQLLLPAAACVGLTCSTLWTAQGVYINNLSRCSFDEGVAHMTTYIYLLRSQ